MESNLSLPINIAKIPAKIGCKYKNVLTVVAFKFVSARGFKIYVPNVAKTLVFEAFMLKAPVF